MSELYSKLHGTTTDSFKIGQKNKKIILTGSTTNITSVELKNRDIENFRINSTAFFTAYVIGKGVDNTAAYEIKGCYLEGTSTISGYVVNTYVDSIGFTDPVITLDATGELFVECFGVQNDTIQWTAVIDIVEI